MSAAIVDKFMGIFGINKGYDEEEDYEIDNDYEVNDDYETEETNYDSESESYDKASLFSSVKPTKKSLDMDDYVTSMSRRNRGKVIPMSSAVSTNSKMVITQPTCYEDVTEITDYLTGKKSIIVNLEAVDPEEARRILDFLGGASYAVDGNMQKVSKLIYLITPHNIEIQNNLEKDNYKTKLSALSWLKS